MSVDEHGAPRHSPAGGPDDARLTSLLAETLAERGGRVAPAPDALARLNTRLDARRAARPWWAGRLRLAGALAAALLLLALVTPVRHLAAAGAHSAAQAVVTTITTVRDFATGDNGSDKPSVTPNSPGTPAATGAVTGSAVAPSPTGSSTSPLGTSAISSATRTGTTTPGTATGTTSGAAAGTVTSGLTATPDATATRARTATPTGTAGGTPAGAAVDTDKHEKSPPQVDPAKAPKSQGGEPLSATRQLRIRETRNPATPIP